ncbi:MAG: hypothetical protein WC460_02075 [Patescibacteria group bacterium]
MKLISFKVYLLTKAFKGKSLLVLIFAIFVAIFCLPKISSWAYFDLNTNDYFRQIQKVVSFDTKDKPEILRLYVTAYASVSELTDNTPCISASGYDLCKHNVENVVAANFLPFGAKVKFPDLDPDKVYTVVDRMHERYNSRLDIWMNSIEKAKKFGLKKLTVEIYKD